ncbi:unnamed protein product [Zymoseptoria tritici ST99CH_3D1]|nr:unnamed protein product [Zymoseptoria tritici ST99CH_3D1]
MSVAIAGLARIFGVLLRFRPEDYIFGIWRPRLAHELMWRVIGRPWDDYQRTPGMEVPSWSWLSISGAKSTSRFNVNARGRGTDRLHVMDLDTIQAHGKSLRIRGKLCEAVFKRCGEPTFFDEEFDDEHHQQDFVFRVGEARFREIESCTLCWDEKSIEIFEEVQKKPLYLLHGRIYEEGRKYEDPADNIALILPDRLVGHDNVDIDQSCRASRYDCLILEPTGKDACFRHLGHVELGGPRESGKGAYKERRTWPEHNRHVLDRQFAVDDVPRHYYEEVDNDWNYTIWLRQSQSQVSVASLELSSSNTRRIITVHIYWKVNYRTHKTEDRENRRRYTSTPGFERYGRGKNWGVIGGLHKTADGYVRFHAFFPNHRAAALQVLDLLSSANREEVAA